MTRSEFCAAATAAANPEFDVPEISVPFAYVNVALLCSARSAMVASKVRTSPKLLAPDQAPTMSLASSASGPMRAILLVALTRAGGALQARVCSAAGRRTPPRLCGQRAVLDDGSCHLCTFGEGMIEEAESKLDA